jgi:hypothetical protein
MRLRHAFALLLLAACDVPLPPSGSDLATPTDLGYDCSGMEFSSDPFVFAPTPIGKETPAGLGIQYSNPAVMPLQIAGFGGPAAADFYVLEGYDVGLANGKLDLGFRPRAPGERDGTITFLRADGKLCTENLVGTSD